MGSEVQGSRLGEVQGYIQGIHTAHITMTAIQMEPYICITKLPVSMKLWYFNTMPCSTA